jgi:hypothetical protein
MSGQGTFVWKTGERYDGEWKVRQAAVAAAAAAQYALPADAVKVQLALAQAAFQAARYSYHSNCAVHVYAV